MQLDLESGTICQRTSDNWTCHISVSDSRWRHVYLVSGTTALCESLFNCVLEILLLAPLLSTMYCLSIVSVQKKCVTAGHFLI